MAATGEEIRAKWRALFRNKLANSDPVPENPEDWKGMEAVSMDDLSREFSNLIPQAHVQHVAMYDNAKGKGSAVQGYVFSKDAMHLYKQIGPELEKELVEAHRLDQENTPQLDTASNGRWAGMARDFEADRKEEQRRLMEQLAKLGVEDSDT